MEDASRKASWLNPVRTTALFILGLWAVYRYHFWVGGTGGLEPARMTQESSGIITWTDDPVQVFLIARLGLPLLILVAAGLLVALLRTGRADAEAGMRHAILSNDAHWMPGAARFWAVAARVTAWGGVLIGLAACGVAWVVVYRVQRLGYQVEWGTYHDRIIGAYRWGLFAPLAGIVFGRVVFGALAEGARIRSGEGSRPVFSRLQDLAFLALFAIPWVWLWLVTEGH